MPHLAAITIYPIKSLDGVQVFSSQFASGGALQYDRHYAFVDANGRFINSKRYAAMQCLRSSLDLASQVLTLGLTDAADTQEFHLDHDRTALEAWLSDYLQTTVSLIRNDTIGFPDDTVAFGPTIISTATLETVASWYPDLTLEAVRWRFRANLEVSGVPAFWEDRLFSATEQPVPFTIGDVTLLGVNPCQRCIVPTRDALTGVATARFQATFTDRRRQSLPPWVAAQRFNHFYRLSVNTQVPPSEVDKRLTVGDPIAIVPSRL